MNINRENYELVIIDFLDGKLDEASQADLMRFLNQNADLKEEFDLLQTGMALEPNMPEVPDFSMLKKQEALVNIPALDLLLIDKLEGNLRKDEEQVLDARLAKEPALAAEYVSYQKTILKVDTGINYPNPELLKKQARVIELFSLRSAYRIAAVLTLGSLVWLGTNQLNRNTELAMEQSKPALVKVPEISGKPIGNKVKTNPIQEGQFQNEINPKVAKANNEPSHLEITRPIETPINRVAVSAHLLEGKYASLDNKVELGSINKEPLRLLESEKPAIAPALAGEFKTPAQWIKERAMNKLPMEQLAKAETLIKTGDAGAVALNLLNQAPGLQASAKTDEKGQSHGFSIASRYFSIERSY